MWSRTPLDRGNFTHVKIRSQEPSRNKSIVYRGIQALSDLPEAAPGNAAARTRRIAAGIAILLMPTVGEPAFVRKEHVCH